MLHLSRCGLRGFYRLRTEREYNCRISPWSAECRGLHQRQHGTGHRQIMMKHKNPSPYSPLNNYPLEKIPTEEPGIEPAASWSVTSITTERSGQMIIFVILIVNYWKLIFNPLPIKILYWSKFCMLISFGPKIKY